MSSPTAASLVPPREGRPWALFLDRDGVINQRVPDDYVRSWSQFRFLPGALPALADLAAWAPFVVVVTNQQGVGKGRMTQEDLDDVHRRMVAEVAAAGGRIDDVLVCPHLASEGCECRKPACGLALRWLEAHPAVDGGRSVMVGDQDSDREMAANLAARTGGCVFVGVGPSVAGDATHAADLNAFAHVVCGGR